MARNILSLDSQEAMDFFMKSEQYHGFELPKYFTFDHVLKYVRETIEVTPYEECVQESISPDELSDVNLDILLNKDGRCAIRLIMVTNPFLQSELAPDFNLHTRQNQRNVPSTLPARSKSGSSSLIEKRLIFLLSPPICSITASSVVTFIETRIYKGY